MFLRLYLFTLYLIIFLSAGLCGIIIYNVNPYQSPSWMILLFYLTLFLFWASFFSLIGFYLKIWASNREVIFAHLKPTLRQSMLISSIIIGIVFFQQLRILNWWIASLFIIAILMLELFFKAKKGHLGGQG